MHGNLRHMFVAELVVLTSANYSICHHLEGLLYTLTHKEYYTGVVSSVLMSVCAQKSPVREWLVLVHDSLCSRCRSTLAH